MTVFLFMRFSKNASGSSKLDEKFGTSYFGYLPQSTF